MLRDKMLKILLQQYLPGPDIKEAPLQTLVRSDLMTLVAKKHQDGKYP
jgi:hypothetical protein